MAPPPSREHAPVTDAEAEELYEYHKFSGPFLEGDEEDITVLRLLAARARAQERIRELETRLEARSRSVHSKFVQERRHDRSWQGCYAHPCKDDRALLEEVPDGKA